MAQIITASFEPPAAKVIGYLDAIPHLEPDGTCLFMVENQRGKSDWFTSPQTLGLYERVRIAANEQKRTHAARMAALVKADSQRVIDAPPPPRSAGTKSEEYQDIERGTLYGDSRLRPDQRYHGFWAVSRRMQRNWYGDPLLWVQGRPTLASLAKHAKKYDMDLHGVILRNVEVIVFFNLRVDAVRMDRGRWLLRVAKAINRDSARKLLTMEPRKWYRHKVLDEGEAA